MSSCTSALQEPPQAAQPQTDHPEYYGKGFQGKKFKTKAAAKDSAGNKTLADKRQVLVEEMTEPSGSESSEADIEVKIEDFDVPGADSNRGAAVPSGPSTAVDPQPMKLLPPPRPGMQPVDVCSLHLCFLF